MMTKKKKKTLANRMIQMATLAFDVRGGFDWFIKRRAAFEQITYERFRDVATALLGRTNRRRVAVLIDGDREDADVGLHYKPVNTLTDYFARAKL
jgi:hypothetical protein